MKIAISVRTLEVALACCVVAAVVAGLTGLPATAQADEGTQTGGVQLAQDARPAGETGAAGGSLLQQATQSAGLANPGQAGLVTNVFADEDIRQALRDIAAQTGAVIIPDETVQGIVSCELRDVTVDQALELVLFSGGYVYKKINGWYLVGSSSPSSPNFTRMADVARLSLRHTQAQDVYSLLSPAYQQYITADPINNVMVVTAPEVLLNQIISNIAIIDQPSSQIMIEVMVVEMSVGKAKELGMRWRWNSFGFDVGDPLLSTTGSAASGERDTLSWTEASTLDLANIRLLIANNDAEVRANPRVSTLNGRDAEIFVGREQYFSVYTGNAFYPTTQLKEVQAGITLKIRPILGEDGKMIIHLDPEVSDIVSISENGAPEIATRRVHTVVRCMEGRTIVIGGLTQFSKRIDKNKVPLLGDLPIIGNIFRNTTESKVETEVVIFLRPTVMLEGNEDRWEPVDQWPDVRTLGQRQEARDAMAAAQTAAGQEEPPAQ